MGRFLAARLAQLLPSLLLLTLAVFFLTRFSSSDAVGLRSTDRRLTPLEEATLREELGLDRSLPEQYVRYVSALARGDWGTSFRYKRPVWEIISERFPFTAMLALTVVIIELAIGMSIAVVLTARAGPRLDFLSSAAGAALVSLPTFWLAMMVQQLARSWTGSIPVWSESGSGLSAFFLAASVLAAGSVVHVAWIFRARLQAVLKADYVTSARSFGLRGWRLWGKYILPNAAAPAIAFIATDLGALLGGAVATEAVFNLPGLGGLIYQSVLARDRPVVIGVAMVLLVGYMVANLAAELVHIRLDPRLRSRTTWGARR